MARRGHPTGARPTREEMIRYLRESPRKVGKRDLARAFGLSKANAEWLGTILREFSAEGVISRSTGRRAVARARDDSGAVPPVAVLQVVSISPDGDVFAAPAEWKRESPAPRVHLVPVHGVPAPAVGDRVMARNTILPDGSIEGRIMRILERGPGEVVGIFQRVGTEGRIVPTNKRRRVEYRVRGTDFGDAEPGDVVVAEVLGDARVGLLRARVRERIGGLDDPRTLSLIAIHEHEIPTRFSPEAMRAADEAHVPELGPRIDFRAVPFITIDPADARDFDDAVWAEPVAGGWEVKVAIADVAHYVRPGTPLDRDAQERGNSVYLPDRVVPMMPHALSGGMCSLQEGEERACMVATMAIDKEGNVLRHRIERGLMRSAMRLTYERAQEIHDRGGDPLAERLLAPVWGAYDAFAAARARRTPLEIESPELVVRLGADGRVADVRPRVHLESMRLIEEYMIAANLAAALTLEASGLPTMYRVHDEPEPERVANLRTFLEALDYTLSAGQRLRPQHFNAILRKVKGTAHEPVVNQSVLRTQSQAVYSPDAAPHFGLALRRYVHFTSPIRRYSDLVVHRALIAALHLGNDGLQPIEPEAFARLAAHISGTERRAMMAERDATDRYLAAFLSDRVGAEFSARISGVTSAGLFVTLLETGAQALIPMRTIGDERYFLDEQHQRIIGERSSLVLRLGDPITVRLVEATAASGGLLANLVEGGTVDHKAKAPRGPNGPRRPGARPGARQGPPGKGASRGHRR